MRVLHARRSGNLINLFHEPWKADVRRTEGLRRRHRQKARNPRLYRSTRASLRSDYEQLVSLSGKGAELSQELGRIDGAIEAIAEQLLAPDACEV